MLHNIMFYIDIDLLPCVALDVAVLNIFQLNIEEHFSRVQVLKETQMTESNFSEDCQNLIKRDLESWKSYFSKWEVFAKQEEIILKSELQKEPFDMVKSLKKKKVRSSSSKKKLKRVSSLTFQRNQKLQLKCFNMAKVSTKSNIENKVIKKSSNFKPNNIVVDPIDDQTEIILKSVFTKFLKANVNNLEIFAPLSQIYSNRERIDSNQLFSQCQQALTFNELQSNKSCLIINQHISPSINTYNRSICPDRDIYIQSLKRSFNFYDLYAKPVIVKKKSSGTENLILSISTFPKLEFNCKNAENQKHFGMSFPNNKAPQQTIQRNFDTKTCHLALFDDPKCKNMKLKPFKLDFSHKSLTNTFRKINKEYFIKKSISKMNISQDEERIKNLHLYERANSVSLSTENSNFITPERKPSERKCFSESVLQRKRGHPTKLFFDNEEEDSESDDQTQNQAPLIYYKNKIKRQVISRVLDDESDSDDCESIFDRIKKS